MGFWGGLGEKKSPSLYQLSWVPGGFRVLSGGHCTEGELIKKGEEGERWSGDEESM